MQRRQHSELHTRTTAAARNDDGRAAWYSHAARARGSLPGTRLELVVLRHERAGAGAAELNICVGADSGSGVAAVSVKHVGGSGCTEAYSGGIRAGGRAQGVERRETPDNQCAYRRAFRNAG